MIPDARDFYSDQPPREARPALDRPEISPMTDWQSTPIFIVNHDNLERGFRKQVAWLRDAGMTDISVLDNASTYPPLLDYYAASDLKVIRLDKNYGPWVFWEKKMHEQTTRRYIVSDPDVVPDAGCPKDLVKKMSDVFDRYLPLTLKVGPGIRVDNIPDHYIHKQVVLNWETTHVGAHSETNRGKGDESDVYCTSIDTTFAMYGAGCKFPDFAYHFRLAAPYELEHIPWYEDSSVETEEHKYYMAHANMELVHW
jgi:hypothetical protein